MELFAERLRKSLKENGISQRQLATKLGVSQSAVNKYCTGKSLPNIDNLITICKTIGKDADFLLCIIN